MQNDTPPPTNAHSCARLPREQPRVQAPAGALPQGPAPDLARSKGHGVVQRQRRRRHDRLPRGAQHRARSPLAVGSATRAAAAGVSAWKGARRRAVSWWLKKAAQPPVAAVVLFSDTGLPLAAQLLRASAGNAVNTPALVQTPTSSSPGVSSSKKQAPQPKLSAATIMMVLERPPRLLTGAVGRTHQDHGPRGEHHQREQHVLAVGRRHGRHRVLLQRRQVRLRPAVLEHRLRGAAAAAAQLRPSTRRMAVPGAAHTAGPGTHVM